MLMQLDWHIRLIISPSKYLLFAFPYMQRIMLRQILLFVRNIKVIYMFVEDGIER